MLEEIKYKLKRKLFRQMEAYDITLDELKEKQMKGAEIIDVRNKREYDESHILGFLVMGLDKHKAKMAERRIPENTLFMFTILGGGIGTIAGMYVFHHKTKKMKFKVGMPLILILEILIFVYFKYVM